MPYCSLGVGCEEAGGCYAAANGRLDMCGYEEENPDDFDRYGNPIDGSSQPYCCSPDCGCPELRLCMAEKGSGVRC